MDLQKKFDTNQTQCRQLSLHNEQLKSKCQNLQDKFDHLQRNHVQLIQRLTQQVRRRQFFHETFMFFVYSKEYSISRTTNRMDFNGQSFSPS